MKQFFVFLFLLLPLASGASAAQSIAQSASVSAGEISGPVDKLHATLLTVMKQANTQDITARFQTLRPVLASSFDMRLMTALSTGSYWSKAADDAKLRLVAAFQRFSVATYAARFDGWSGQSFETLGIQDGPRGTRLVRTRINRPQKDPVPLSYVVRKSGAKWHVVDILLDTGISEIAVRRSEYSSTLKSGGIPALTDLLNARADKLLAPRNPA